MIVPSANDCDTDSLLSEIKQRVAESRVGMNSTIAEQQLSAFESRHRIVLPTGYRRFLLEVGNGGAGPGYGLEPLDTEATLDFVAEQFPLDKLWIWDAEDLQPDPLRIDACRHGWIKIGTEGCGLDWVLIVSGSQRGNVWSIDDQGAQPCAPGRSFLSWYLLWLKWAHSGGADGGADWWDVVWAEY